MEPIYPPLVLIAVPSFWLALAAGIVAGLVLGLIGGIIAIRVRGVYFALITFGLAQVVAKVIYNTRALGASDGLMGVPVLDIDLGVVTVSSASPAGFFLITLAIIILLYAASAYILDTPFGRLLIALRANDRRVPYLGYRTTSLRLSSFMFAAVIATVSGTLYPMLRGFASPELLFFSTSGNAVITVVLGGVGTLVGRALWQHPADHPQIGDRHLDRAPSDRDRPAVHGCGHLPSQWPDGTGPAGDRTIPDSGGQTVTAPVLEARNLSISFGGLRAVDQMSFTARRYGITTIIGPNGAGKSTLFNLISGALRPQAGSVFLEGVDCTGSPPYRMQAAGVARSFQITNLLFELPVAENLRLASQVLETPGKALLPISSNHIARARVDELLERFGLAEKADLPVAQLSHGEQRRLEVAVALACKPKVLMLDEPTQGMSHGDTEDTATLIRTLSREVTVLLIEHDIGLVMSLSDHVIVMHQGRKLAEGTPDAIRANASVQTAYFGHT